VTKKVEEFNQNEFDLEKKKDRDKIRSFAANVSKSKAFIDKARLEYVRDKKEALKVIDREGKRFRDTMDEIKETVRKPLTAWEEAEKSRIEAERQHGILLMEWDEAISEDEIFNREKAIAAKEAEFARIEADRKAKEEAEQREKERIENEDRIKKEAAENAKREAEEKIRVEREAKEKAERDAKDAIERAEREKIEAKEREEQAKKQAEFDRIAAEERAAKEKEEAIRRIKEEAERKAAEQKRIEEDKARIEKEISDKKAANKRHQAHINNIVLSCLESFGLDTETSKRLIIEIAQGRIEKLKIEY